MECKSELGLGERSAHSGVFPSKLTPIRTFWEPVLERKSGFSEVFLLHKHVLVPQDEFENTKFVGGGEVDWKIKGGFLGWVDGV